MVKNKRVNFGLISNYDASMSTEKSSCWKNIIITIAPFLARSSTSELVKV